MAENEQVLRVELSGVEAVRDIMDATYSLLEAMGTVRCGRCGFDLDRSGGMEFVRCDACEPVRRQRLRLRVALDSCGSEEE